MAGKAISIKNLSKVYRGKVRALEGVSLDVEEGEFFGFLGPNGAGKTTTINALTGLANFDSGEVQVFGHDVVREYQKTRRMIGLVPQEFNFDPYMTIEQILLFEGGYFGVPKKIRRERAKRLLNEFELYEKRSDDYRRLSGGMKRRLLIARALMHDPKILILDEPTAGVDLEIRHKLWQFFRDLNASGRTIFLTTHYIEEAERLCSRIGVIYKGRIVALNDKEELVRGIGGHWIELKLRTAVRELPSVLQELGVSLVDGNVVRFPENPETLHRIMREIHSQGWVYDSIDVRKSSLEETFMKLTGMSPAPLSLMAENGYEA